MSDSATIGLEAFESQAVASKLPTYEVDDNAPRAVVVRDAAGLPVTSVTIGRHRKGKYAALVLISGETQVGFRLEAVGAALREGIISPAIVRDLQIKGGVYNVDLHLEDEPEPDTDESEQDAE